MLKNTDEYKEFSVRYNIGIFMDYDVFVDNLSHFLFNFYQGHF